MSAPARDPLRQRAVLWLVVVAVSILACCHVFVGTPLIDAFHEGEYISARLLFAGGHKAPLLIHGYMDYVPAMLAERLFGGDHVIAGTRLLSLALGAIAAIALFGCLLQMARGRAERLGALLIGTALLWICNLRLAGMVALLQGSPAVRDMALLFELWCLLAASAAPRRRSDLLAAGAGLIAGLGFFWAYNRGVLGLAGLAGYGLATQWVERRWRHVGAMAGGAIAGMLLAFAAEPATWPQHIANIFYWQQHGSIWHLRLNKFEWAHYLPFFAASALILLLGLHTIWRGRASADRAVHLPRLAMLLIVAALAYQSAFNRPDEPHLYFVVPWLALLGFAIWTARTPAPAERGWREVVRGERAMLVVAAALLLLDMSPGDRSSWPALLGLYDNMGALAHGLPGDRAIAAPRLQRVAAELRRGGGRCTYAFDNSGMLYHLAALPPCTAIMIPVYAAGPKEAQLIAELTAARPPLVIGRSTEWNDHIDDQPLDRRTPRLGRWLVANYRLECNFDGIEIWRALPNAPGSH